MKNILVVAFFLVFLFVPSLKHVSADTWNPDISASAHQWSSVASSEDGTKLAATEKNGSIFTGVKTSTGFSWTRQTSPLLSGIHSWSKIVSSADGNKLAVVEGVFPLGSSGARHVYTGVNSSSGFIWTSSFNGDFYNGDFYSVASSADGDTLVVADKTFNCTVALPISTGGAGGGVAAIATSSSTTACSGNIWVGKRGSSGFSWMEQTSSVLSGNHQWMDIASSADGTKLVAVENDAQDGDHLGGYIYTGVYSGTAYVWNKHSFNGAASFRHSWYSVASSADGSRLAATAPDFGSGYIWTSRDSGVTWVPQTSLSENNPLYLSLSADGLKLITASSSYIYKGVSAGGASDWVFTKQASAGNHNWLAVTSSFDGNKLAVVEVDGSSSEYIYRNIPTLPTVSTVSVTNITGISATISGKLISYGDGATSAYKGFVFGTSENYGYAVSLSSHSIGTFFADINHLVCNTMYHFNTTATNAVGTGLGSDVVFTTGQCLPSSPTATITQTPTGIMLNGSIGALGGESTVNVGFVYGLVGVFTPTTTTVVSKQGASFSQTLSGFSCNTIYHVYPFATNSFGIVDGADAIFTTGVCDTNNTTINSGNITPSSIIVYPSGGSTTNTTSSPIPSPTTPSITPKSIMSTIKLGATAIGAYDNSSSGNGVLIITPNTIISNGKYTFTQPLSYNSSGAEVTALQQYLEKNGYLNISPTGYYGRSTEIAVEKFQIANNIPIVGYVGPITRQVLNSKQ